MANLLKELKGGELLLGGRKQQQQPANSLSLSLLPFTGMHYSTYSQQDSQIKRGKNGGKNSTKKTRRRRSNNDSVSKGSAQDRARRILGQQQQQEHSSHLPSAALYYNEEEELFEEPFEYHGGLEHDFFADEQSLFAAYGLVEQEEDSTAAIRPMAGRHHYSNSDVIRVPMLEDIQEIISQENSCPSPATAFQQQD